MEETKLHWIKAHNSGRTKMKIVKIRVITKGIQIPRQPIGLFPLFLEEIGHGEVVSARHVHNRRPSTIP